jgi:hypothetical protein
MSATTLRMIATSYFAPPGFNSVPVRTAAPQRSLWLRLVDAVREAREQRIENEIARFIQRNGGALTDKLDREISRRYGSF